MSSSTHLRPRRPVWDAVLSPHRLSLGLRQLGAGESWLDLDEDLPADLAEKDRLFREHPSDVLVELPDSREAQIEVLECVVDTLLADHPNGYQREAGILRILETGEEFNLRDPTRVPIEVAGSLRTRRSSGYGSQPRRLAIDRGGRLLPYALGTSPQARTFHDQDPWTRPRLRRKARRDIESILRRH